MKKSIKLCLSSLVLLTLCACGVKNNTSNSQLSESNSNQLSESNSDQSSSSSTGINYHESGSGKTTIFPQSEINAFFNLEETVPSYQASEYNFECGQDDYEDYVFEIYSTISTTASASSYKTICEQAGLTVDDSYYSTYGIYLALTAESVYQIQFYEDSGYFYIDIYENSSTSYDVETSTVFPQSQIDTLFSSTEIVPSYEADLYNYISGTDDYGDLFFEVYSTISTTASTSSYKTICEKAGLTVDDTYYSSYGVYIASTINGVYEIQFGEDADSNEFYIDIYLAY